MKRVLHVDAVKYFITESADIIKKRANFLLKKGTKLKDENEFNIEYSSDSLSISIVFERYADASDISIRFIKENKSFSVGWIVRVYDDIEFNDYVINKKDKLINVLGLLNFIEDYYEKVTDINFCEDMMLKVDDFIKNRI